MVQQTLRGGSCLSLKSCRASAPNVPFRADFVCLIRKRRVALHKFDDTVRLSFAIRRLWNKQDTISKSLAGILIVTECSVEVLHVALDVSWQVGVVCEHVFLFGFNRRELKAERKMLVDSRIITE